MCVNYPNMWVNYPNIVWIVWIWAEASEDIFAVSDFLSLDIALIAVNY